MHMTLNLQSISMNIIQLILTTTLAEACNLNFTDKETDKV